MRYVCRVQFLSHWTFIFSVWLVFSCFNRPILNLLLQLPSSVQTQSSAARTASAFPRPLCATARTTVTTAATRFPAQPSPAALGLSSAKTLFAFLSRGPAMATPTAATAQTSGRGTRTATARPVPKPLLLASAPPWSSTALVGSASTAAGSVMERSTASINQTKQTVVSETLNNS